MQIARLLRSAILKSYQLLLGIWLTYFITNQYSLELYGVYSAQIARLFIFGYVLKLGFDILVLKENNRFRLFKLIFPTYMVVMFLGILICSILSIWLGVSILSILAFSITLVLAEMARRKNSTGTYILLSGGLQYSIQALLFLSKPIVDSIGVPSIVLISVSIPCVLLLIKYNRVFLLGLERINHLKWSNMQSVMEESVGQLFFNLSSVFNNWLGTYLLSLTGNMDAVAIFTAVKRITNGLSLPQQVLNINFANPLARSLNDLSKLRSILLRQRKLFFYTSIIIAIGGMVMTELLTYIIKLDAALLPQLWTSYYILIAMVVINALTGPTFIFTRISGGLGKKVVALNIITIVCYGLAMLIPNEDKLLAITIATFTSITLTNFYLMIVSYLEKRVFLHARP